MDSLKNTAIPAIRAPVNGELIEKIAVFSRFRELSASFLCQGTLFHFCEKTALASFRLGFQKALSGCESAPGAREKSSHPRATRVTRNGKRLSVVWGQMRRAVTGERRRGEFGG